MAEREPLLARRPRLYHPSWLGGGEPEAAGPTLSNRVGSTLRAARLGAGLSLADAATRLRIRRVYLEAIEEGRYQDLPGAVYAIGFVRSYAETMGLDGDLLVKEFKEETSATGGDTELHFPEPIPEGRLPGWRLLVISAVIVIGAYGAWNYLSSQNRVAIELIPDVPERIARLAGVPTLSPMALGGGSPPPKITTVESSADGAQAGPNLIATSRPAGAARGPSAQVEFTAPPTGVGGGSGIAVAPFAEETPAATPDAPLAEVTRTPSVAALAISPQPAPAPASAARVVAPAPETGVGAPVPVSTALAPSPQSTRVVAPQTAPATLPAAIASAETTDTTPPVLPPAMVAVSAVTESVSADAGEAAGADAGSGYVPQVYGAGNTDARVVVTALMDSWVQVTGTDNALHLTRILRGGDRYMAPNRPDLMLTTGNVGALELAVDGKTVPPLGPVGAVRRNISLSPERLLAGTAVTP